jgi:DNA polymerase-3 subunit delta'
LFKANNHPDFKMLAPAEPGKAIVIDQVRELSSFYSLKPHYQRGKITMVSPANVMNRAAANALLKVLEEPPDGALLILVAHDFSALPMTVRSRCARIACEYIDAAVAARWLSEEVAGLDETAVGAALRQSGGAPLLARELASSADARLEPELLAVIRELRHARVHPLAAARQFSSLTLDARMQLLTTTLSRLIFAKFGCNSLYERAGAGPDPSLQDLVDHLDLKHLYVFLDLLFETKALVARHSGFRDADLAEVLWLELARTARG